MMVVWFPAVAGEITTPAPFVIEIATFAPHAPYTPASRDADAFPSLRAPRTPEQLTHVLTAADWKHRTVRCACSAGSSAYNSFM